MLSAELSGAEAKDPDGKSKLVLQVVNTTCKPLVRDLAKNFDEEDERKKATATATALAANALQREQKYQSAFNNVIQAFTKGQIMHQLAAKYMTHQHYWKIFIPVQIIVTLAALLAFFAAALDAEKQINIAFWLSLAAGALGFVAAFLNTVDRYLDWRTRGEMHKKAASVYGKAKSEMSMPAGDDTDHVDLADSKKKLANLNESIGELQIPYPILNAFDQVEGYIRQQIHNMNNRYRNDFAEKYQVNGDLWKAKDTNDFLVAAYTMVANEITKDKRWPWALPDPHDLAVKAHKRIQNRLLHVRFRDNRKLMSSLLIDYDSGDENWRQYAAADKAPNSEAGPAPAPAAASATDEPPDVENGAGTDEESD